MVYMFLNGGGMRGGPVHHHIAGTPFLGEARTAARYRFFAVGDDFPGLWPVAEGGGSIAGELYDVPLEALRDNLLPDEPAELELGVIELADGAPSLAMLLRSTEYDRGVHRDITAYGGWRAYRRSGKA
ncbi:MAG: allophanate hydrolase-related protein [Streptomycetales bacterium]